MKRYTKLLSIFSLLLLLSLTMTGLTSAEVLRGKGWLYAKGSGMAVLKMTGHIEITSHGSGAVYIRGAESVKAEGDGIKNELPNGGVIFRGYTGTIKATGEKMFVRIIGQNIEFKAHGKGTVVLRGSGYYETGGGGSGDWAPDGLTVEVVEE